MSGEVVFGEGDDPFAGATAYIRVEEVSRADAPSQTVAEQVVRDVSHREGAVERLPFEMRGIPVIEQAHYTVSVHLDVDRDGQVSRGDYLTMESYPVLTFGYPRQVIIRPRKLT